MPTQIYGCSEEEARWFFQQFIIGLDYCHRMGIANRDIKLDNILLHGPGSRPVVKICDFGYSKDEVAGSICKTACGTPEYMAPEVRPETRVGCCLSSCMQHVKLQDVASSCTIMHVAFAGQLRSNVDMCCGAFRAAACASCHGRAELFATRVAACACDI